MRRRLLLLAALCACAAPKGPAPSAPPRPPEPPPVAAPSIDAEFPARSSSIEEAPRVPPEAGWRFLVSTLASLRANAAAYGEEILVSFEPDRLHATRRSGARRTILLPAGFRLEGGAGRLRLGADLSMRVYGPSGLEPLAGAEVRLLAARLPGKEGGLEFRLVVKAGSAFRTIETAG